MSHNTSDEQKIFITDIVNTALEQASIFQSQKSNNSKLNIRDINIRIVDVILIILFVMTTVFGYTTNYYKIRSYTINSKPKIEKLENQMSEFQIFKLETIGTLKSCKNMLTQLQKDTKFSKQISIDASDQVQNIYSNVNILINKIEKLEKQIAKIEK